jgi:type I restriction enzyme S subunit
MWRLSKGMAQPNISPKQVVAISMGLPPLAEQERIVEILEEQLSRLDAALESVRVVREKAAQFRRSLLHAAFTGTLTGHNPTDGELPEGWRSGTLIDAAQVTMGQSPPGSSYNEIGDGEPFFQGKAEFGALHPTVRKWTTAGTRFAQNGDILMSVRAPVGPTNVADIDCVIGRGLAGIRAREHVDQTFLLWNLRHFEHEIAAKGTGTTFDSISGNDLKSQGLSIPPLAEQEQIVEILDEQLSRLDTALAVADAIEKCSAALRRSLLHAAFTGRLTEQWRESVHV